MSETVNTETVATITRGETLADAIGRLKALREKQYDVVVGREDIAGSRGRLNVKTPRGTVNVVPTPDMEAQMASELGWSLRHFRSARQDSADMVALDMGLIGDGSDAERAAMMGEAEWRYALANRLRHGRRAHMIRTYQEGGIYTGRSFHSPSYGTFDNLDCAGFAMEALLEAGLNADQTDARMDLTERRMVLRVNVPGIRVLAEKWLEGYKNPIPQSHSGYRPGTEPIVEAGVVIVNGETGHSSLSMAPYFRVLICQNGATVAHELAKFTYRHKAAAQAVGEVPTGNDTRSTFARWMTLTMRDNLRHWLSEDYLTETIAGWTAKSGREVEHAPEVIREVGKGFALDDPTIDLILNMWTRGGQATSGGVGQAFTAAAQVVLDAELAWLLEVSAQEATERAFSLAR